MMMAGNIKRNERHERPEGTARSLSYNIVEDPAVIRLWLAKSMTRPGPDFDFDCDVGVTRP